MLDGHLLGTVQSRPAEENLSRLSMRGARPADPSPDVAALPRMRAAAADRAVEIDRLFHYNGYATVGGEETPDR
ncbi:hypothetical protein [Streptomyces goshikiensis]|uniref:hypothetical protein n=1 Tax=Streptomyces goshikiensis TaxID=1942 RepID=UPI0036B44346